MELPRAVPRFLEIEGDPGAVIAIEELVRSNLASLYPESMLEQAFVFRVTRSAELDLDEAHADDLLDEVARAAEQRGQGMAVRLEVERSMPGILRALLLENLRRELPPETAPLVSDVEEVDGLLDLAALTQLPVPDEPALRYAPLAAADPFAGASSAFAADRSAATCWSIIRTSRSPPP